VGLVQRYEVALQFAERQLRALVEQTPDFFPIYTRHGVWKHEGELWTDWCGGFLAGMMWLLYEQTGDRWWRIQAEHYSQKLEHRQFDRNVHDLGFMSQLDLEEFRALEEWIGIQGRATTRATETSRAPEDSHRRNKEPDRWEGEP